MGRLPHLQFMVLYELAQHGPCSEIEIATLLRRNPPDICDVFRTLLQKEMVNEPKRHLSESGKHGRPREYYQVNEKGIEFIISFKPEIVLFWRTVLNFSYNMPIDIKSIEKFFGVFSRKFLNYSSVHGFMFQIESWNNTCTRLYDRMVNKNKGRVGLDQKILESLALNRGMKINELVHNLGHDKKTIFAILSKYLPREHKPFLLTVKAREALLSERITTFKRNNFEFQSHQIISVRLDQNGENLYELTLFGILFILYLIRNDDRGISTTGLFHALSLKEYVDKIARAYQNKLSLIFGKWSKITDILGPMSVYNFDFVLYQDFRMKSLSTSGNHRLYKAMIDVASDSHQKIAHMHSEGFFEMIRFVREMASSLGQKYDLLWKKISPVYELWTTIGILLNPLRYDPESFKVKLENDGTFNSEEIGRISNKYDMETIEREFANEITFLYYLGLNYEYFQMEKVSRSYHKFCVENEQADELILFPKAKMLSLLHEDGEIRQFMGDWITDALKFLERTQESMKALRQEIDNQKSQ